MGFCAPLDPGDSLDRVAARGAALRARDRMPRTARVPAIGANDVVNRLARQAHPGLIAGIPILDVDKARTVVVIERFLAPGFASIISPLLAADNTLIYSGSAKEAVLDLVAALQVA